jgi:hypothetical protein
MIRLSDALRKENVMEAAETFESLLEEFEREMIIGEEDRETTLQDPVLLFIVQHQCHRICHSVVFCPVEGCRKPLKNTGKLLLHLRHDHDLPEEETCDLIHFSIKAMLPGKLKICLTRPNGTRVHHKWNVERSHYPHCPYLHSKHSQEEWHLRQHKTMQENIAAMG